MIAAKAYASRPKARRVFVVVSGTIKTSDPNWVLIPPRHQQNMGDHQIRNSALIGKQSGAICFADPETRDWPLGPDNARCWASASRGEDVGSRARRPQTSMCSCAGCSHFETCVI